MTQETARRASSQPQFNADAAQRLLAFLPACTQGEFQEALRCYEESGQYQPILDRFRREAIESGFLFLIDWSNWQQLRSIPSDDQLTEADLVTLRRMVTHWLRQDQLVRGILPAVCSDGRLHRVLLRLKQLYASGQIDSQ